MNYTVIILMFNRSVNIYALATLLVTQREYHRTAQ